MHFMSVWKIKITTNFSKKTHLWHLFVFKALTYGEGTNQCFIIVISNNKWKMKFKENSKQNESLVNEKTFTGYLTPWQMEPLRCPWPSLPVSSPSFRSNLCPHFLFRNKHGCSCGLDFLSPRFLPCNSLY